MSKDCMKVPPRRIPLRSGPPQRTAGDLSFAMRAPRFRQVIFGGGPEAVNSTCSIHHTAVRQGSGVTRGAPDSERAVTYSGRQRNAADQDRRARRSGDDC